jgi:hypothetical protein
VAVYQEEFYILWLVIKQPTGTSGSVLIHVLKWEEAVGDNVLDSLHAFPSACQQKRLKHKAFMASFLS